MSLEMSTRNVAGGSVLVCSGRIVLGEESAKLRHLVKEALGECKYIVAPEEYSPSSHPSTRGICAAGPCLQMMRRFGLSFP